MISGTVENSRRRRFVEKQRRQATAKQNAYARLLITVLKFRLRLSS